MPSPKQQKWRKPNADEKKNPVKSAFTGNTDTNLDARTTTAAA